MENDSVKEDNDDDKKEEDEATNQEVDEDNYGNWKRRKVDDEGFNRNNY